MKANNTLTAVEPLLVGHATLSSVHSGCTVILAKEGVIAGVDVRGGAPGTYGTDVLKPVNLVDRIHGLFFTGGSAFGLGVGDGVRRFLKDKDCGFDTRYGRIPIVAGAVIFDLGLNQSGMYPDADLAYKACMAASSDPVEEGCVGAGAGATAGKLHGVASATKTGLGTACIRGAEGLIVAALMVANPFGDIYDPATGRIIAGCRRDSKSPEFLDMNSKLRSMNRLGSIFGTSSTIVGVVATNASLTKTELTKVAQMAHDGMARTVYPAHTLYDGDTIFALSCGNLQGVEVSVVGALAAQATAEAIIRAARKAKGVAGLPSSQDLLDERWPG